jgi:hypothetical protein
VLSFLKLLNGTDWNPFEEGERKLTESEKAAIAAQLQQLSTEALAQVIAQQLPKSVLKLRRLERTVACSDFEILALEADTRVARTRCLPRRNLKRDLEQESPGHVSLIILPQVSAEQGLSQLITSVEDYLTPKLLLTTQLHVVGPQFVAVGVQATVVPLPDALESTLRQHVVEAVTQFLNPHTGGEDGKGWPFGRNVFVSEMYSLLDQLPSVDYVTALTLIPPMPARLLTNSRGEVVGVEVKPYELVAAQIAPADVTVQTS